MRRFPGVGHGNFRSDVAQTRFQIDFSFFLKFEQRQSHEGFADGANAKFRVAGDGAFGSRVGIADSAAPEQFAARNESHARSRHVILFQFALNGFLQFLQCLRRRGLFFLLRSQGNG